MTRRDYVLIAAALKQARDRGEHAGNTPSFLMGCDSATLSLASILAEHNPRFDRPRFLRDSGVPAIQ